MDVVGTHVIHETFATKDVGEEARGVLDVRATFAADHLLAILIIYRAQVLSNQDRHGHNTASAETDYDDAKCLGDESGSTTHRI